jgi:hypothetical protein
MGTRNLTCVVKDGEFKVAQYCQWDGYPTGQGKTIVEFIQYITADQDARLVPFFKALDNCQFIDHCCIKKLWVECGADPESDMVPMDVSDKFAKLHPQFHRDTGANILDMILKHNGLKLNDERDFAAESLFCEYAYVLDMDQAVLEIYKGFHKGESVGRFSKLPTENEYSPVTLYKTIPFNDLNEDTMRDLEEEMNGEEE